MARVKVWVSDVPEIPNLFLIEHDDGREDAYLLRTVLAKGDRLGTAYRGDIQGYTGVFYDLPFGFPTSNDLAAQRMSDPSIPAMMKKLIVDNFPLQVQPQMPVYS